MATGSNQMIDQRANEIRKIRGIINRLSKERNNLDVMAAKYGGTELGRRWSTLGLEEYAECVEEAVEEQQSAFVDYKRINQQR